MNEIVAAPNTDIEIHWIQIDAVSMLNSKGLTLAAAFPEQTVAPASIVSPVLPARLFRRAFILSMIDPSLETSWFQSAMSPFAKRSCI